jgi:DNA mismatch endonuclease (patch repair protein)
MERQLKRYLKNGTFENVSEKRSRAMSAIRGKYNRSTELRLRMALIRAGIKGWKLHAKELPGNPDFFIEKEKVAVFVDGCYWHGCPKCGHIPKTRSRFWAAKIKRNQQRDRKKRMELTKMGITPIRIWEHELKITAGLDKAVTKIKSAIKR